MVAFRLGIRQALDDPRFQPIEEFLDYAVVSTSLPTQSDVPCIK